MPDPIPAEARARLRGEHVQDARWRWCGRDRENWPCTTTCLLDALDAAEAQNVELRGEVREWLCDKCNTVYPGPPQKGFACVQCPQCGGNTGPRNVMELRTAEARCRELEREHAEITKMHAAVCEQPKIERADALAAAVEAEAKSQCSRCASHGQRGEAQFLGWSWWHWEPNTWHSCPASDLHNALRAYRAGGG